MKMGTTGGLVSAYQLLDCSAQRVAAHCLSVTDAEELSFEVVSIPDPLELYKKEFLKIKVAPWHDQFAFTILAKRFLVEMLPGHVFGITREALKALDEVGISYEVVE
jgi:hypothetical protein